MAKRSAKKTKSPVKPLLIHPKNNKPEAVYSVKKMQPKSKTKLKIAHKKKHRKSLEYYLRRKVSNKNSFFIISLVLLIAFGLLIWQGKIMTDAKNSAKNSAYDTQISDVTLKTLNLIGNGDNFSNEIQNFNSAPDSLKEFVISDYRRTKAKCIVNGEFIGMVGYKIENVVNDNYAKIIRICNGEESLIVHSLSGKWVILHTGNGPVDCAVVNDFSIPRGVLANCNTGIVQYTNPNP